MICVPAHWLTYPAHCHRPGLSPDNNAEQMLRQPTQQTRIMNTNTTEAQPTVTGIGPADLLMMNPAQGPDQGRAAYDGSGSGAASGYGDELANDLDPQPAQGDDADSEDISQELNENVKDDLDDDSLN